MASSQELKTAPEVLKLITWNVFMLPKPIHFSKQRERVPLIVDELEKLDHDIVFLNEAFTNGFRNLAMIRLQKKYPYQEYLRKSRRLFQFFNSGVIVFSKHPFEVLGWHYYSECTLADCFASKGVMLIEVTTPKGNKVHIAATHMQAENTNRAYDVRKSQLIEIKSLLDSYSRQGIPQLLVGDLNIDGTIDREYPGALELLGMKSTFPEGPILTTNGFGIPCYNVKPTEHPEWLDHIWIKEMGTEAKVTQKKVRPIAAMMSPGTECSLSDHHAVEANLEL